MITIKLNPKSESELILNHNDVKETVGGVYSNNRIPQHVVLRRWDTLKSSFFEVVEKIEEFGGNIIIHTNINELFY
jgi:hypothetical protein